METISLKVPHNGWLPRPHQNKLWEYLQFGGKRAVAIWHRRAGKDEVALHHTMCAASKRPGNYWHCFPEFAQARKGVWDSVNPHTGKRRIDEVFPQELRAGTRDHDMQIRLVNGSTWQCIGSDSVVSGSGIGSSTAGIVFSEYALANPSAWAYYRPILEENNGWAAFVSTPRGRNHCHTLFQYAAKSADWFCELLTAKDTHALSEQALAETLSEYCALYGNDQGQAMYDQELLCSWNASVLGAYFAVECAQVRREDRILEVDAIEDEPVHTAWDLGVRDDTSIWMWQTQGSQCILLDHYSNSQAGVEHYVEELEKRYKRHGWRKGIDFVPHDAKVKEFGSGRTRIETMQALGLKPELVRDAKFIDGINAARRTLPMCVFHPRTEETGFAALEQYHREWDDERKAFKATDVHDWTAHPAASFRYLSLAWRLAERRETVAPKQEGWHIPPPAEQRYGGIRL